MPSYIGAEYGDAYVPDAPRKYSVKAKNAQEAHEAVRPTVRSSSADSIWLATVRIQISS
jgi:DNA topoisomerase IA